MERNARATNTTPHRVGQLAKARREVAALLDGAPDPDALAGRIIDDLQALGWTPPRDPSADVPAARVVPAPEDSPGRQAFRAALADLHDRDRRTDA